MVDFKVNVNVGKYFPYMGDFFFRKYNDPLIIIPFTPRFWKVQSSCFCLVGDCLRDDAGKSPFFPFGWAFFISSNHRTSKAKLKGQIADS